ncbi:MAG: hypothetical protein ACK46L_08910 [Synechococcaceae cyanobacterium]
MVKGNQLELLQGRHHY